MQNRTRLGFLAFGCAALTALGAALAPTGCTIVTNDAGPDDGGVFEGGDAVSSTACTSCVTQQCTGAWAVCLTDPGCLAVKLCKNPLAESAASVAACMCAAGNGADASFGAVAAYDMFAACNDARLCTVCATDCASSCTGVAPQQTTSNGVCGDGGLDGASDAASDADAATDADDGGDAGDADAGPPPAAPTADGCANCVNAWCGDPKKLCGIATDCEAYLRCVDVCTSASCAQDCGSRYASGKASATTLANCTLTACRPSCGL